MSKIARNYVAIVLDRSGSMDDIKKQTITGFNEQVQQIKANAASGGAETFVSLVSFNGDVFEHLWNKPASELSETNDQDYRPTGSTSMRDAVGYTIDKMRKTTDSGDEANSYLLIIISDGDENTSSKYSQSALREIIDSCQNTKRWTITYMGCGEEYLKKIAESTHIPMANMASWSNDAVGAGVAFKCAAASTGRYLRSRGEALDSGQAQYMTSNFYSPNDECFADLVSNPIVDSTSNPNVDLVSGDVVVPSTTTTTTSNVFGTSITVNLDEYKD